jgi:hypothetical protein
MEVSGQLYLKGKSPWYPLDRRLGGPQSRSGRCGEEKYSQPLSGLEPPIIQLVTQSCTTELSQIPHRTNDLCEYIRLIFGFQPRPVLQIFQRYCTGFPTNMYAFLIAPMRTICPAHLIYPKYRNCNVC